jgi:hypothetical protein
VTILNSRLLFLATAVIFLLLIPFPSGRAQEETPAVAPVPAPDTRPPSLQTRQQLEEIQKSIQEKRTQIEEMRKQLNREKDEIERRDLERRIEQEETDISNLRRSFENIALGGVDLSVFDPQLQNEQFNWQDELQQILKPLFQELKDLTEKPRQIERLKSRLDILDNQAQIAQRALNNVEQLLDGTMDKATSQRLESVRQTWVQRLNDIQREREINQLQLNTLQQQDDTLFVQIRQSINDFVTGRGLNLVLAIAAFLLTYFLMKGLYVLYGRLQLRAGPRAITTTTTSRRMLAYIYQGLSVFMSILAVLVVLYILGDILLLVLVIIILLFILLGLRNYLPQFIDETKLLLNIGAVRERERVVYKGLPWMVRSLGVYSKLYNPALDGLLRLPLSEVLGLVSRPYREDEPWFPTRTGDYVMMSDGTIGQVLRQTPEIVQLKTKGTVQTHSTTNFLAGEPRNLSEGFGISITFGIDYQHQSISTTEIPRILHQSIKKGLQETEAGNHVEDILVEFKEAGASSLDYQIYVTMKGEGAEFYFALTRLVQKICVDTCNEQGWVIPFNQMTIHAGTSFEAVISSGHGKDTTGS